MIKPHDSGESLDQFECRLGGCDRNAFNNPLFAHAKFGS